MERLSATIFAGLIAVGIASAGLANEPPGYFKVIGVEAGDTLTVRAGPAVSHQPVGALPNGAVVSSSGESVERGRTTWQKVSTGESDGWASARYLKPAEAITYPSNSVPVRGQCGGFEPGWDFSWNGERATVDLFGDRSSLTVTGAHDAQGIREAFLTAVGTNMGLSLIITPQACLALPIDGFVWGTARMLVEDGSGPRLYVGCCTPVANAYQ